MIEMTLQRIASVVIASFKGKESNVCNILVVVGRLGDVDLSSWCNLTESDVFLFQYPQIDSTTFISVTVDKRAYGPGIIATVS